MDVLPLSFFSAKITKTAWNRLAVGKLVVASAVVDKLDQHQSRPTSSTLSSQYKITQYYKSLIVYSGVRLKWYTSTKIPHK